MQVFAMISLTLMILTSFVVAADDPILEPGDGYYTETAELDHFSEVSEPLETSEIENVLTVTGRPECDRLLFEYRQAYDYYLFCLEQYEKSGGSPYWRNKMWRAEIEADEAWEAFRAECPRYPIVMGIDLLPEQTTSGCGCDI